MKHKIVIGIDQSYADSGITVGLDGKIKTITDCYTDKLKTNTDKRLLLKSKLTKVFSMMQIKQSELNECDLICIIERIRLQSSGFLNIDYIKGIGALNAMIVDLANEYDIPVYSVDTRAWKSAIVGTSKPYKGDFYGIDPKKVPTILWLIKKGYKEQIKEPVSKQKKNGVIEKDGERFTYNDNKADSAGICLYGFLPEHKQKLEREH